MTRRIWSVWVLSSSGTSKSPRSELPGLEMTDLFTRTIWHCFAWLAITTLIVATTNSDTMRDHLDHDTPLEYYDTLEMDILRTLFTDSYLT